MAVVPLCLGGMFGALVCWAWHRSGRGPRDMDPAVLERVVAWGGILLAVAGRLAAFATIR